MDLCLDLEVDPLCIPYAWEIIQEFFSLKFGPNKKKFCLARIKLQPTHPLNNVATSQEIP